MRYNQVKLRILDAVSIAVDKWFKNHPNEMPFLHMRLMPDHRVPNIQSETANEPPAKKWVIKAKRTITTTYNGSRDGGKSRQVSIQNNVEIPHDELKTIIELGETKEIKDYKAGQIYKSEKTESIQDVLWVDCPKIKYKIDIEENPLPITIVHRDKFTLTQEHLQYLPSLDKDTEMIDGVMVSPYFKSFNLLSPNTWCTDSYGNSVIIPLHQLFTCPSCGFEANVKPP